MNNIIKLCKAMCNIVIIAIVAVSVFGAAACATYNADKHNGKEVKTDGRLTITGLDTCIGQEIIAVMVEWDDNDLILSLQAGERAFHQTYKGKPTGYKWVWIEPYIVTGDTATLKVYQSDDSGNRFHNYTGNDQNIEFTVFSVDDDGNSVEEGTVTVNFTNGIGSGVFVPDRFQLSESPAG